MQESNSLIEILFESTKVAAAAHEYSYILMTLVVHYVTEPNYSWASRLWPNVASTALININYNLLSSAVNSSSIRLSKLRNKIRAFSANSCS